jgi:hypothetical protein
MNITRLARRCAAGALAVGILTVCTAMASPGLAVAPVTAPSSSRAAADDDREGPQFYTGAYIDVAGAVDGDVYAAGQTVTISGDVSGDVIAAAQIIIITGTVDGDVRLAGQDVDIRGEISRSGTIFAEDITVSDTGSFGGDLVGGAGTVRMGGDVGRDLHVSVGRLTIDGSVDGNVTYVSDNDARIAEGAVAGSVERVDPPRSPTVEVSPWAVFAGWLLGLVYAFVAFSLITLLAALLLPRWLDRVTDHLLPSPWRALLVGFLASITVPIALISLLVTIIGAPLALAGGLVWLVLTMASFVYAAHYLGRLIFRGTQHPVVTSLVGGLILIAGLQIPWLNIFVWLAMVFLGVGAQLLEFYRQRPWSTTRSPDASPPVPAESRAPAAEPSSPLSA